MKEKYQNHKKIIIISFIAITLFLTWIFQFLPLMLGLDIDDTSVSSSGLASAFFTIGGMMPTLIGIIFVFVFYIKEKIIDFLKRCFIPNKRSGIAILIALGLIAIETTVTQLIARACGGEKLGFEGISNIISAPYLIFWYLFWGLISGPLSEEFGWRGFLTDQMWDKKKISLYPLLIGALWGVWHLPLFFYPAQIQNEWVKFSPILAVGFVVNCMTNALVYNSIYVFSKRKVFPIFFLHMFENIIMTGIIIYPFSDAYKISVIPVSIVLDLVFYFVFTRLKVYNKTLEELE